MSKFIRGSEPYWTASYVGKGEWTVNAVGFAVGPRDAETRATITTAQWNDYGNQLVDNPNWCNSTLTLHDHFRTYYLYTEGAWSVFENSGIVKPSSGSAIALEFCVIRWPTGRIQPVTNPCPFGSFRGFSRSSSDCD